MHAALKSLRCCRLQQKSHKVLQHHCVGITATLRKDNNGLLSVKLMRARLQSMRELSDELMRVSDEGCGEFMGERIILSITIPSRNDSTCDLN